MIGRPALEELARMTTGLTLGDYPVEILETGTNAVNTVRIHPPVNQPDQAA